jgi:hypothetical protein
MMDESLAEAFIIGSLAGMMDESLAEAFIIWCLAGMIVEKPIRGIQYWESGRDDESGRVIQ